MDLNEMQSIFTIGETVAVEFKRCGNGIESDTYETVCSFLNRFGGDLFLGVLDCLLYTSDAADDTNVLDSVKWHIKLMHSLKNLLNC